MTAFCLKLLAVVSMLIDHTGIVLYDRGVIAWDPYLIMRVLGRFAFPIYAFLLAEGFRHLRDDPERLRKHALLLLVLAALSELPFDWMSHGVIHNIESQNVIFTLLFGFLGLWLSDIYRDRPLLRGGIWLLAVTMGWFVNTDYGAAGVLLVFLSSIYLERVEDRSIGLRLLGVLGVICGYYAFYTWAHVSFGGPRAIWERLVAMRYYLMPHLLLIPVLAAYRGERGPKIPFLHRCYQWFYPAHLALLCLIGLLLDKTLP